MKRVFCHVSNSTMKELRILLNTAEKITKSFCIKRYHFLLSDEIEFLTDSIALNIVKRPDNLSILESAMRELNARICYAAAKQAPVNYNLSVIASVATVGDEAYLMLTGTEDVINGLLPQLKDVGVICIKNGNAPKEEPVLLMQRQLFPNGDITPDKDILKFHTASRRGMRIARYNLMNRLLSTAALGKEIQNYQLMYFMDMALEELNKKDMENEVKRMGAELSRILPEITYELITG